MCRIALPREVRDEGLPLSSAISPDLLVWEGGAAQLPTHCMGELLGE